MKTVCIYHSIDLDGWMSAAIVKYWFDQQEVPNRQGEDCNTLDFIGYNYGDPIPDLSEYDKVIMCDISFPIEEMENLRQHLQDNFIWIDHHISAIKAADERTNNYYDGIRDTKFAACELTWKYFFPEPDGADYHAAHIPSNLKGENIVLPKNKMPEIVRLLGRYDCFGHKGTEEEQKVLQFQYAARESISDYEEAYSALCNDIDHNITEEMIRQGIFIYNYLCTDAKQSYKNGFKIELGTKYYGGIDPIDENTKVQIFTKGFNFICINKERFNPINFGIDYHSDGYDGAMCWHLGSDKMVNISFYNDNGKVDCSAIAKSFGGGGHRGAAGCRMNIKDFQNLIK